jgi:hypothetical protein
MKKQTLLFIPLLILLACKKNDTAIPVVENTIFKDVILAEYKQTIDYKMTDITDMGYLGYVTDHKNIKNKDLTPFIGTQIINNGFSLKDVDDNFLTKTTIDQCDLSTYRQKYHEARQIDKIWATKISYQIYAGNQIDQSSTTDITLVIKAIYFYTDLNAVKDENLKSFTGVQLNEMKESGVYLSKIGYGASAEYRISSKESPKKIIPYLKAYLDDQLNNKGANAKSLRKDIHLYISGETHLGGKIKSGLFDHLDIPLETGIETAIQSDFAPQSSKLLIPLEFGFRSLKDGKTVN